jgi:hypothetical protein
VGCSGHADVQDPGPATPDVLLHHCERAQTSATGGDWRRRWAGSQPWLRMEMTRGERRVATGSRSAGSFPVFWHVVSG